MFLTGRSKKDYESFCETMLTAKNLTQFGAFFYVDGGQIRTIAGMASRTSDPENLFFLGPDRFGGMQLTSLLGQDWELDAF